MRFCLWATIAILTLSSGTDLFIAADVLITGGDSTAKIIAIASLFGVTILGALVFYFLRYGLSKQAIPSSDADRALLERLSSELEKMIYIKILT